MFQGACYDLRLLDEKEFIDGITKSSDLDSSHQLSR